MDEMVLRRLAEHIGVNADPIYVAHGKDRLQEAVPGYNSAARFSPWAILVDLDRDEDCAPPFVARWLPAASRHMCFRVAVRTIEAWLMADRERLAAFLHVPARSVPGNPETLPEIQAERDPGRHGASTRQRTRGRSGLHVAPHRVRDGPPARLAPDGGCALGR